MVQVYPSSPNIYKSPAQFTDMPKKNHRVDQFIRNPRKALFTLALPILVSFLVQALYNIVDTAFIGRISADAIAALTLCFPLFFIIFAFNAGVGTGTGSRIARYFGAKKTRAAENTAMHGIIMAIIVSVTVALLGIIFLEPILILFGATGNVLDLAIQYMRIVFVAMAFLTLTVVTGHIFQAQGDTKTPMIVHTIAFGLNVILDPIFIFVLGLGVKGAAIATAISFTTGATIGIILLLTRSQLRIRPSSFHFSPHILKEIAKVGVPAGMMFLNMSLFVIFLNRLFVTFGTEYIASFGIIWRLNSLVFHPILAVSIALLNLVGIFKGAKRFDLIKKEIWYAMKVCWIFAGTILVLFLAFPKVFISIFTNDPQILALASTYLRLDVFQLPFIVVMLMLNRSMQGLGWGFPPLVIQLIRTLLVSIPLAYIFVLIFNMSYLSIAVSYIISTALAAAVAAIWFLKKSSRIFSGSL
jgi:putative MATE family efflux protein